jgi:class 3 adenylate cyclase/tetratricopeptide (TPR) repeat protein
MLVTCPVCTRETPADLPRCGYCGSPLLPSLKSTAERRIVTLVFADIAGSTALGERLDPEAVRHAMTSFFEIARAALDRHGGTVEKFIGDAVMAAFGIPVTHEDDALRAVRAAIELREETRALGAEIALRHGVGLGVRIGVNTGEVVTGDASDGQAFASGDAVNVAARLEQAAAAGEVLVGEATMRLVRGAVEAEEVEPLAVKGKSAPLRAWRLRSVAPHARLPRAEGGRIVGRAAELERLTTAWALCAEAGDGRVVNVVAPAGTGKTRLLAEFVQVQADAGRVVAIGTCRPYGEDVTFRPMGDALRGVLGVAPTGSPADARAAAAEALLEEPTAGDIVARLGAALGADDEGYPLEETFWAVRRLLAAEAQEAPVALILDDLHWAKESLLDLVEYLVAWSPGTALLLVLAGRPEMLERRPSLAAPRPETDTLLLAPLDDADAAALARDQLGSGELPAAVERRVLVAAEGNPLFVQELVRMLVEDGALVRGPDRWIEADASGTLAMPATIGALLRARLDQLEDAERDAAQRASVIGQQFSSSALRALADPASRARLGALLGGLSRKGLIRPAAASSGAGVADDVFQFTHVLIRDAAYDRLAKSSRASLHEAAAAFVAEAGNRDVDEIAGHHLEQAARARGEIGDTEAAIRNARNAAERLARAGRRALSSGDMPAAAGLLQRAADLADPTRRPAIVVDLIPALVETGRADRAREAIAGIGGLDNHDVAAIAPSDGEAARAALAARAWETFLRLQHGDDVPDALTESERWLTACERDGDDSGAATALDLIAKATFWSGRAAEASAIWRRAAARGAAAGDRRSEGEALVWLMISAMYGPLPAVDGLAMCDELTRDAPSAKARAVALIEHGVFAAMLGNAGLGRDEVARGREALTDLGLELLSALLCQEAAIVEQFAGDAAGAIQVLQAGLTRLVDIGEPGFGSTVAVMLARARCQLGDPDIGDLETRYLASDEDLNASGEWHATRGLAAALRGDAAQALERTARGIEHALASDFINDQGHRHLDRADALRILGRIDEAREALGAARDAYQRKGATAGITLVQARARALDSRGP